MKNIISRFIPLSLLISLMAAFVPVPVYAASVTSVNPNEIASGVATVITVTGADFDNNSKILLDGAELPGTVFVDANTLRVTVPADIALGSHMVTVTSADGSATLTVTPPAPPPSTATLPFTRPQFVVSSSKTKGDVSTNSQFTLNLTLANQGTSAAYSVQIVFTSTSLAPLKNGGVVAEGTVAAGDKVGTSESFLVTGQTYGQSILPIDVTVTYYDEKGTSYSDKFTLSVGTSGGGSSGVAYATSTPTGVKTSQLVIPSYAVSVDPLQPGLQFVLTMTVQNVGNVNAQRVTMIVGGGSSGTSGGTPQPGGVSGGSGEFTNFAPVGASNVQSLGDLAAGDMIQAKQNLIVNTSTNPGAYPMKVTFSYLDKDNEVINDEQVITLLVYSLPNVDVSFYRPPDPFMVGQSVALPIQVVNIGKRASVLGNIKVSVDAGTIDNSTGLVGSIDAGGYFTIDSMFTPEQSGKQKLHITIEYTDDFNQPRTLKRDLELEVMEGAPEESALGPSGADGGGGGSDGLLPLNAEETTMHKIFRFIKGLFGLDSSWPVWQAPGGGGAAPEETVPVKPGGGKG